MFMMVEHVRKITVKKPYIANMDHLSICSSSGLMQPAKAPQGKRGLNPDLQVSMPTPHHWANSALLKCGVLGLVGQVSAYCKWARKQA